MYPISGISVGQNVRVPLSTRKSDGAGGHFFCLLAACTAVSATPRLCSSAMWLEGGSPLHARKMFSMQQRCEKSAFTTGVPGGTSGALMRYERSDMIGWKSDHSARPAVLYWMREVMSARMARSRMSGVASRLARARLTRVSGRLCGADGGWDPVC